VLEIEESATEKMDLSDDKTKNNQVEGTSTTCNKEEEKRMTIV
jgi:hypothetical protein